MEAEVIMFTTHRSRLSLLSTMIVLGAVLLFSDDARSQKKEESYVMTEAELQAHVMGFADRLAA